MYLALLAHFQRFWKVSVPIAREFRDSIGIDLVVAAAPQSSQTSQNLNLHCFWSFLFHQYQWESDEFSKSPKRDTNSVLEHFWQIRLERLVLWIMVPERQIFKAQLFGIVGVHHSLDYPSSVIIISICLSFGAWNRQPQKRCLYYSLQVCWKLQVANTISSVFMNLIDLRKILLISGVGCLAAFAIGMLPLQKHCSIPLGCHFINFHGFGSLFEISWISGVGCRQQPLLSECCS